MSWAKLALVLSAAAAMTIAAFESSAGGRSGRSHAHSGSAHRHHAHHPRGVFFGGFWYSPYYYPYYYYYPPGYYYPPAMGPADPYWYYCRGANAYYPYVRDCPGGWERYLPSPQSPLG